MRAERNNGSGGLAQESAVTQTSSSLSMNAIERSLHCLNCGAVVGSPEMLSLAREKNAPDSEDATRRADDPLRRDTTPFSTVNALCVGGTTVSKHAKARMRMGHAEEKINRIAQRGSQRDVKLWEFKDKEAETNPGICQRLL